MSELNPKYLRLFNAVREKFPGEAFVPLHAPVFGGREKDYLIECIDSTFVSSVGAFVDRFEAMMAEITGTRFAVATMNGTAALHMALIVAGVKDGDEVITQPLSFVATCNAIAYQRAHPVFVDIDRDTLGLSPLAFQDFLETHCCIQDGQCINRVSGRRIGAVVPMHTFGLAARIEEIIEIAGRWKIPVVEDAAEALGSVFRGKKLGSFGTVGAFSFNGNKIVTSGGGGCIVTDSPELAKLAKHLTTTAKVPHPWEFFHDQIGYNYRLPNINAALACAQLEQIDEFILKKRELASFYASFCNENDIDYVGEPDGCLSNYWLNAILVDAPEERDLLLSAATQANLMMRPVWKLMTELPAFEQAEKGGVDNAVWVQSRLVNLPSSVPSL